MNCATCAGEMLEETSFDMTIDRCLACKAFWLDSGELSRVLRVSNKLEANVYRFVTRGRVDPDAECPRCDKSLSNWDVNGGFIKPCLSCNSMWIDQEAV
jgi:Zn-finger nucleic acid-binding protein